MITIKSQREIDGMARSGKLLADMHIALRSYIKAGLSTMDVENFCRKFIEDRGGRPAELGFEGYKYATCVAVDEEVAHAIPSKKRILKNGDLVKVDTVVDLDGYYSDSAWAYAIGEVSPEVQSLMDVTHKALYLGIDQAQVGNRIGDIGNAIQSYIDTTGYGNVRDYIGHGIQPTMHEDPAVPHYGVAGHGTRLKEGMTLTIEPMINMGSWEVKPPRADDGWTVETADGSWSCQYEHTLVVTKDGPKILTSQDPEFDAKYLLNN